MKQYFSGLTGWKLCIAEEGITIRSTCETGWEHGSVFRPTLGLLAGNCASHPTRGASCRGTATSDTLTANTSKTSTEHGESRMRGCCHNRQRKPRCVCRHLRFTFSKCGAREDEAGFTPYLPARAGMGQQTCSVVGSILAIVRSRVSQRGTTLRHSIGEWASVRPPTLDRLRLCSKDTPVDR